MIEITKYLSKTSGFFIGFIGFLILVKGTWVETFFRWIFLGVILDFVYLHYVWIMITLTVIFFTRWIKDWRWLLFIGLLVYVFFSFSRL